MQLPSHPLCLPELVYVMTIATGNSCCGLHIASSFAACYAKLISPAAPRPRSQLGQHQSADQQQQSTGAGTSASGTGSLSNSSSAAATGLPTTSSCLDLLQQGRAAAAPKAASKPPQAPDSTVQQHEQLKRAGSAGGLAAIAAATAAAGGSVGHHPALSKLMSVSSSTSWSQRQAEVRAAALSGIKWMPDKPLALLYRLVELMKVGLGLLLAAVLQAYNCAGGMERGRDGKRQGREDRGRRDTDASREGGRAGVHNRGNARAGLAPAA